MHCNYRRTFFLGALISFGATFYILGGEYGFNALITRGGSDWIPIGERGAMLPVGMKLALSDALPPLQAGAFQWTKLDEGLETAELPILSGETSIDSILLTRINPKRFRFALFHDPSGATGLDGWMKLKNEAVVLINGSYYARDGLPATPFLEAGKLLGPAEYKAEYGAFVAANESVSLVDLAGKDWKAVFAGAANGFISYPLLVGKDAEKRMKSDDRWLANRSFIAEDSNGFILLGTTTGGTFSLRRLAEFLKASPLQLIIALNLDGGPVACQGVQYQNYIRNFCGSWETHTKDGNVELLEPRIAGKRWALPIVLAVFRK